MYHTSLYLYKYRGEHISLRFAIYYFEYTVKYQIFLVNHHFKFKLWRLQS